MINETTKEWLFEKWGTNNPIRIDASTAWEILQDASCGCKEAKSVWVEYADHKRLPEDPVVAAKEIPNFDKFLTKIYVDRLRF
jgi:hypothetical protein